MALFLIYTYTVLLPRHDYTSQHQILRNIRECKQKGSFLESTTSSKELHLRLIMTVMATKDLITARSSNATPSSVMWTSAKTIGRN